VCRSGLTAPEAVRSCRLVPNVKRSLLLASSEDKRFCTEHGNNSFIVPTYQTTRCNIPEDPIMSERSTGFSNILCVILRPLLAFVFVYCRNGRTVVGTNSGELSGMATTAPPYQANGEIYFLYQTRHRKLVLLCRVCIAGVAQSV
jgi:hypothetical protein